MITLLVSFTGLLWDAVNVPSNNVDTFTKVYIGKGYRVKPIPKGVKL